MQLLPTLHIIEEQGQPVTYYIPDFWKITHLIHKIIYFQEAHGGFLIINRLESIKIILFQCHVVIHMFHQMLSRKLTYIFLNML